MTLDEIKYFKEKGSFRNIIDMSVKIIIFHSHLRYVIEETLEYIIKHKLYKRENKKLIKEVIHHNDRVCTKLLDIFNKTYSIKMGDAINRLWFKLDDSILLEYRFIYMIKYLKDITTNILDSQKPDVSHIFETSIKNDYYKLDKLISNCNLEINDSKYEIISKIIDDIYSEIVLEGDDDYMTLKDIK